MANFIKILDFFCLYTPYNRIGRLEFFSIHIMAFVNTFLTFYWLALMEVHYYSYIIAILLTAMPVIAIINIILSTFKRLHDINRSAWFSLISFLPVLGFIFTLVLCFKPGTRGENLFGPQHEPPKHRFLNRVLVVGLLIAISSQFSPLKEDEDDELEKSPSFKDLYFEQYNKYIELI